MRSALRRLSYRAATRPPDQSELSHKRPPAPCRIAFTPEVRDDRKNLRHNFSPPISFPIADLRLRTVIGNWRSTIANIPGGPRGSRTHYLSIKSRALILMSFRPQQNCELRIANFASGKSNSKFEIRHSQFLMLRPRLGLGSRTDLVLAGYKPAALPIELPEREILAITLLPGLRNLCFAIKASSAWRWRQDSNPRQPL